MSTQTCSDKIIPSEIGGLIADLFAKLSGPRARFWLKALKRLARKENPWISFEKVLEFQEGGNFATTEKLLEQLEGMNLMIFGGLRGFVEGMKEVEQSILDHPLPNNLELPAHSIIDVRLGDLTTLEERSWFTYKDICAKAQEEYGFDQCDPGPGLAAAIKLVEECKLLEYRNGPPRNYIICSETFQSGEDGVERLLNIHSWPGDRKLHGEQGSVCLYAINSRLKAPNQAFMDTVNAITNPETRLLFKSVPR